MQHSRTPPLTEHLPKADFHPCSCILRIDVMSCDMSTVCIRKVYRPVIAFWVSPGMMALPIPHGY